MFKVKRALALILIAAIMLSLAACTQPSTDVGGGTSAGERIPAALTFREADGTIIADNSAVKSATVKKDGSDYAVLIKFNDAGKEKFAEATARLIGQTISIYLDDEELMSPTVNSAITDGEVLLVGERVSTKEKAEEVADAIQNGWKTSVASSSNGQTETKPTEQPAQTSKPLNYQFAEVLPPKYDEITKFSEGMAAVRIGDKWGYIDETGAEVIPVQYDSAYQFSEGMAHVSSDWGNSYSSFYIDKSGNQALSLPQYLSAMTFSDGLALVTKRAEDGYSVKFGFIDRSGNEVIPCIYDGGMSFADGFAVISVLAENGISYKFGIIDKSGATIVQPKYDKIDDFSNGMARTTAASNGELLFGFVDKNGNEIVVPKYDYVSQYNSDGYAVVRLDKRYGIIDTLGNEVIGLKYDNVYTAFREGLAAVELDGKVGFVDETGKEIIPPIYDQLSASTAVECYFSQGIAPVSANGMFGFIDKSGKEVVPFQYDEICSGFGKATELAYVRIGGSYGYIDKKGKEVIPIKYAKGSSSFSTTATFSNGLAGLALNGRFGFVDTSGKELTEFKWEAYNLYTGADGIIFVADGNSSGKKWGLLKYTTSN